MKNNRKAFTLIELLAVIVILAIIALIATPIIINVIEKARKGAFEDTAYGVLDGLKLDYVERVAKGTSTQTLKFKFPDNNLKLSGEKPAGGLAIIDGKGKISFALFDKSKRWCAIKDIDSEKVTISNYSEENCKIDDNVVILPTYSILPSGDVWAKSKKVTITYPERENNYVYQYSINGGDTWETLESGMTKELTFNQNGTVIARIYNGKKYFNGSTLSVTKIDTVAPINVSASKVSSTGSSITIKANGIDSESGIGKYEFSKDNGSTWVNNGTNNTYTFKDLERGTYQLKVKITDKVGNESSAALSLTIGWEDGTVVYYNPVTGKKCNDYVESNSKNEYKYGCMKWYVFDEYSNIVQLLLDHNTTNTVAWSQMDNTTSYTIQDRLGRDTSNWKNRARLINAEEIASIVGSTNFKGTYDTWFYLDTGSQIAGSNNGPGTNKYKWLFDNTKDCTSYGCSNSDPNTEGYWTNTRDHSGKNSSWQVRYNGTVQSAFISFKQFWGVRPVITVDKSIIS